MAISYPISLPSTPTFASSTVILESLVGMTQGEFSGAQQTQDWGDLGWRMSAQWPKMNRANAQAMCAALDSLFGRKGTFLYPIPAHRTALGAAKNLAAGVLKANGAQSTDARVLNVKGAVAGSLLFKAGDKFSIANHLHESLTDVTADGSGNAAVDIRPPLRAAVADNAVLVTATPMGTWRLVSNKTSWDEERAILFGVAVEAMEAY